MKLLLLLSLLILITSVKKPEGIGPCSKILQVKSYYNGKLVSTYTQNRFSLTTEATNIHNHVTGKTYLTDYTVIKMYEPVKKK